MRNAEGRMQNAEVRNHGDGTFRFSLLPSAFLIFDR